MITAILVVLGIFCLLGVGLKIVGVLLGALLWIFVEIPLALIFFILGVVLCMTIILIPIGMVFFKIGAKIIIP